MHGVRRPVWLSAIAAAFLTAACGAGPQPDAEQAAASVAAAEAESELDRQLATVRAATEKYQDVNVALADGYVPDPSGMCIDAAMEGLPAEWGAMGVHYLRLDLLGITAVEPRVAGTATHTDFLNPSILLYEPQADGSMVLVGVENLVFEDAWRALGHTEGPSFAGVPFDYMANDPNTEMDEAHGFEPHWDLHLWLFRDNPAGVARPFNPNVTCAHHQMAGMQH